MDEDDGENFDFMKSDDDNLLRIFVKPSKLEQYDFLDEEDDYFIHSRKDLANNHLKNSRSRYFNQDQANFSDDETITEDFNFNKQTYRPPPPISFKMIKNFPLERAHQLPADPQERIKKLKSVEDIPEQYRNIFSKYPYFNDVQSIVFEDVVNTNQNMAISAPTSSGKTVIFELAIVRLLTNLNYNRLNRQNFKIIYMAPIKALCTEKFNDWQEKFEKLHNLKCIQLTGDSEESAEFNSQINSSNIICTTPEKWDYKTRQWMKQTSFMSNIKLFLIDEIHVLGESDRGASIEAVVSRMKTFILKDSIDDSISSSISNNLRFLAISATIPNIEDIASWLGSGCQAPAVFYKLDETYRPVKVKNIVLGFYCSPEKNDYMFENSLSYKLADIINAHSNRKPTLIFCSTRKSTVESSRLLANSGTRTNKYFYDSNHENFVFAAASKLKDPKLKDMITRYGIGYHHAGMDSNDRTLVENLFLNSKLLILFCTSTLALGVNLPAHLVIIKGTKMYQKQQYVDYSTTQILQMIGRAGRPQFDKTATSVIMTSDQDRTKYASLLEGTQLIESQLHLGLIEHLNSEICLGTIINLKTAINWLKSTYLFARLQKNPEYYGFSPELRYRMANKQVKNNSSVIDDYLKELLVKSLNDLKEVTLVNDSDFRNLYASIKPTINGRTMMRYYIRFETMKAIISRLDPQFKNTSKSDDVTLQELLMIVSQSKELEDVQLRQNEKSVLNALNNDGKIPKTKAGMDILDLKRDKEVIRFINPGKVKTRDIKINVLIQAELGCIPIGDGNNSMRQENYRIFRVGDRISKCILDVVSKNLVCKNYRNYLNSLILVKCIKKELWHNSLHIFKQISQVGDVISNHLVRANITTIDSLLEKSASIIEAIINKNPPFGTRLLESVRNLPRFSITFELIDTLSAEECIVDVYCFIKNFDIVWRASKTKPPGFFPDCHFVLGDAKNNLLFTTRLNLNDWNDNYGEWKSRFRLNRNQNGDHIHASLIAKDFVGLDIHESFTLFQSKQEVLNKYPLTNESNKFEAEEDDDGIFYEAWVSLEKRYYDNINENDANNENNENPTNFKIDGINLKKNVTFDVPTQNNEKISSSNYNFKTPTQKPENNQTRIDSFFRPEKIGCNNPLDKQQDMKNFNKNKTILSTSSSISSSSISSVATLFSKEKTEEKSIFNYGRKNKDKGDLFEQDQPIKKFKSSIEIIPNELIKPNLTRFECNEVKFRNYESPVNLLFADDEIENQENISKKGIKHSPKAATSLPLSNILQADALTDRTNNFKQQKQKTYLKNIFSYF